MSVVKKRNNQTDQAEQVSQSKLGAGFLNYRPRWAEWRGWPFVLVSLAMLLRVAQILGSRTNPTFWFPAVDPQWYDEAALRILRGEWGPFPLFRAPVYPTLLAGVYAIFGHDLVAARMLNVLLQGGAVLAIFHVARSYWSPIAAVVSAGLVAVNGMCIFYNGEMLSVSAEILMSVLALWATFRLFRELSVSSVLICGLAWGIAAITRPNFLLVALVSLAALYFIVRPWKDRVFFGAIWLAGLAVPIAPLTIANYVKGGEFVLIATQGGVNFWIGNNPQSTGILSILPGFGNTWTMEDAQYQAERETGRKLRPGELSDFYTEKGWEFLLTDPFVSARFMIRKTALFFNQFEISNNKHIVYFAQVTPWLPPLIYLNFGILIPLALLGVWVAFRQRTAQLLGLAIVVYAGTVIMFFVTSRFRLPAVPWLAWLAGLGVAWTVATIVQRKWRQLLPLILLIPGVLLAYLDLWHLREAPDSWALYMEGNAYLRMNELDSASVRYHSALRAGEALSRTALNLGVIAYRRNDLDSARYWYEQSIVYNHQNPEALNNLGTILEMQGDTLSAMESYREAIAARPLAEDARHNLAGSYFRTGVRYLKAGEDSLAAVNLDSCIAYLPSPIAHYNLAIALGRLNRQDEAVANLNRALELDPQFIEAQKLKQQFMNPK